MSIKAVTQALAESGVDLDLSMPQGLDLLVAASNYSLARSGGNRTALFDMDVVETGHRPDGWDATVKLNDDCGNLDGVSITYSQYPTGLLATVTLPNGDVGRADMENLPFPELPQSNSWRRNEDGSRTISSPEIAAYRMMAPSAAAIEIGFQLHEVFFGGNTENFLEE